ncbi:transposase [Arcobacter sp. FWKO B]|uniref:transposase n=1 Tax=Arcobacter sp. FWKO B TaxID=2593672 RepID=UPI0018A5F802|nr:transposase [Arcobacter sp. FWKO B]QOG12683.1 hypothetical protein FWKOB_08205 [Arcobacter sp. FWKO B]
MQYDYYKRKLPHISIENHYIFITFRTYDSVDEYVKKISSSILDNKQKQYDIDKYLDSSNNGAYFYGKVLENMKDILLQNDNILYQLEAFCIMPNHIHIMILPKDNLSNIIKYIKGTSANKINKLLNRQGAFWQREYYDKVVRDEIIYEKVLKYIFYNPIKAKLADSDERVYCRYDRT